MSWLQPPAARTRPSVLAAAFRIVLTAGRTPGVGEHSVGHPHVWRGDIVEHSCLAVG
jgi:uncharacterized protein (DUF362 family)